MKHSTIAFDSSHREYDNNGFLHVRACNLTREQVAPYYGREIPNYEQAGFDPDTVYYGYRSAEELSRPETVKSINGIPIQLRHHLDYPDAPAKETRVGQTGTDGVWQAPFLKNSLHILDKAGIDAVNGDCRELSLAYAYRPEFISGETADGTHYDFVMRDILAQHLALVESGRAGREVVVCDSSLKENEMPIDEKKPDDGTLEEKKELEGGKADGAKDDGEEMTQEQKLEAALADFNLPVETIAKVKALILTPEDEKVEVEEKEEVEPEPEQKDDVIADALKKCGFDDESEEFKRAFAEGVKFGKEVALSDAEKEVKAEDEDKPDELKPEEESKKEDDKVAQDAALESQKKKLEKEFAERFDAIRACRSVIGEVKFTAFDSAGSVYVAALKKLGITAGIDASNARACFDVFMQVKKNAVAEDKAPEKASAMVEILSNVKD